MWTALSETHGMLAEIADDPVGEAVGREEHQGCPASSDMDQPGSYWLCLRDLDHPGRHIALGHHGLMAAWPGDHHPTLADLEGRITA